MDNWPGKRKDVFEQCNPVPRNEMERKLHEDIAERWETLGKGAIYGIRFYTQAEEAAFRTGSSASVTRRETDRIATALVTVSAAGIERGEPYTRLKESLGQAASGVNVELSPWNMLPPEGHQLAQYK